MPSERCRPLALVDAAGASVAIYVHMLVMMFLIIFPPQKFYYSQGTSTFCSYVSAHVSPSPVAIYKIACMIHRNICEVSTWHVPVCAASTCFQMQTHNGTAHSYALLVHAYIYGHGGHLV